MHVINMVMVCNIIFNILNILSLSAVVFSFLQYLNNTLSYLYLSHILLKVSLKFYIVIIIEVFVTSFIS